ncbi:2-keto-3-deoxygluconate kinase [Oscillospiraceae bacterium]|nr:2-keto-3-deoxygluconate kinase [Oscillospiraceae bacterium]
MSKGILLAGEPMGLFIAQNKGPLEDVTGYSMALAGAEFNVAIGMSRLGHTVGYLTKLGNDPFGKRIVKIMNQNNISTELITHTDERTTGFMLKSSVEQGDPEIFYYRKGSAASTLSAGDVHALDFARYDTLHMTGILPALTDSTREATDALLEKAHENKMLFSFDPNLRPQLWGDRQKMIDYMNRMSGECDIFLPGVAEAGILLEEHRPEYIAEAYLKRGAKTVIVKLGGKGAYYASSSSSGYVAGFPVETIVDTVGAGDGFAAGVLSALREGLSLEDAVRRGNAIGAIQVMSLGDNDGLPTREELDAFMNGKKDWRKEHV